MVMDLTAPVILVKKLEKLLSFPEDISDSTDCDSQEIDYPPEYVKSITDFFNGDTEKADIQEKTH